MNSGAHRFVPCWTTKRHLLLLREDLRRICRKQMFVPPCRQVRGQEHLAWLKRCTSCWTLQCSKNDDKFAPPGSFTHYQDWRQRGFEPGFRRVLQAGGCLPHWLLLFATRPRHPPTSGIFVSAFYPTRLPLITPLANYLSYKYSNLLSVSLIPTST